MLDIDFAVLKCRPVGSDISEGATVLEAGMRLGLAEIGLAASVGASQVMYCMHRDKHWLQQLVTTTADLHFAAAASAVGDGFCSAHGSSTFHWKRGW